MKMKKTNKNNKNIGNKEENSEIKKNKDGVRYILFNFKQDLKKIYKKDKWVLAPSQTYSLFLKPMKQDEVEKNKSKQKKNNKVNLKGDYKKIEKNYKISGNIKKYVNHNEEINSEDSEDSNNSINHSIEKNTQNAKKNTDNFQDNSSKQLYSDLIYKTKELYNKENTKNIKDIFKSIHHDVTEIDNFGDDNNKFKRKDKRVYTVEVRKINENNKNQNPLNNYGYEENIEQTFKRTDKRGYTTEGKRMVGFHDFTAFEDNFKRGGIIRYKKAKIKKFKSHKEKDLEEDYNFKSKKNDNLYERSNGKNTFNFENSDKKLYHYGKRGNSKKNTQTIINYDDISDKENDYDYYYNYKDHPTYLSGKKNYNKIKKIKYDSRNDNYNLKKSQNDQFNISNSQSFTKRKINIMINRDNKSNNSKSISSSKNNPKIINNNSAKLLRKLNNTIKYKEMIEINEIKSKFKKRLIEIDDKLIDAIHYYDGPIDISCISSKNYAETVKELNKKALKNGYKFIKLGSNYFKFINEFHSFSVEIVKIRNNMLYFLVIKNK